MKRKVSAGEKKLSIEDLKIEENNHLSIRGTDLVDLNHTYGSPLFVFDEVTLVNTFTRFFASFPEKLPKIDDLLFDQNKQQLGNLPTA